MVAIDVCLVCGSVVVAAGLVGKLGMVVDVGGLLGSVGAVVIGGLDGVVVAVVPTVVVVTVVTVFVVVVSSPCPFIFIVTTQFIAPPKLPLSLNLKIPL